MSRPVTLFTGQWADLPLADLAAKLMMATFMAVLVPRAAVCAERIQEVLDTPSSVAAPRSPVTAVSLRGSLELRECRIPLPGCRRTGALRHLLRLLRRTDHGDHRQHRLRQDHPHWLGARLFDATSGSVLVDGVDVRELGAEVLCDRIGLVPQRPYLFSGTVATNLRYGKPDATDEELWGA